MTAAVVSSPHPVARTHACTHTRVLYEASTVKNGGGVVGREWSGVLDLKYGLGGED